MAKRAPTDFHPDLTEDRLKFVASLIARGRNDALDRHDSSVGHNAWTTGTCAFAFGKFRIEEAASSGEHSWLGVLDDSNRFIFTIGEAPVRFYKGEPEDPTDRTLRQFYPELKQLSLMLEGGYSRAHHMFRLAVETDEVGEIDRICLVVLAGTSVELCWEIPYAPMLSAIFPVGSVPAEGVELPPPAVRLSGKKSRDTDAA